MSCGLDSQKLASETLAVEGISGVEVRFAGKTNTITLEVGLLK
jgi:hypothetical protein